MLTDLQWQELAQSWIDAQLSPMYKIVHNHVLIDANKICKGTKKPQQPTTDPDKQEGLGDVILSLPYRQKTERSTKNPFSRLS